MQWRPSGDADISWLALRNQHRRYRWTSCGRVFGETLQQIVSANGVAPRAHDLLRAEITITPDYASGVARNVVGFSPAA
jgi:hypothetical protein